MSKAFSLKGKGVVIKIVFVLSIVVITASVLFSNNTTQEETTTTKVDPVIQYKIEYDPSMYNISISSDIMIDNQTYTGRANIMNILNENESMVVDITLNETEELLYKSEHIYSEEMVEFIQIQNQLPVGKHPANATFNVYDAETQEYLTQIVLDIYITIVNSL